MRSCYDLLRDSEEDFVLSSLNESDEEEEEEESDSDEDSSTPKQKKSTGLDLDKIAQRAELERFYLAFAYTYNNRPELCALFWGTSR